jgi:hypothetical protein
MGFGEVNGGEHCETVAHQHKFELGSSLEIPFKVVNEAFSQELSKVFYDDTLQILPKKLHFDSIYGYFLLIFRIKA